jgi:hypothetical protein
MGTYMIVKVNAQPCVSRSGVFSIAAHCTERKIVLLMYPENDSY